MDPDLNLSKSELICGTCGSRLLPRANYCHFCGKKLSSGPGYLTPPPPAKTKKKKKPRVKKESMARGGGSPVMGCLAALLGILLLGALGTIGGGYWRLQKQQGAAMRDLETQLREEIAAADAKFRAKEEEVAAAKESVAEEKKSREATEQVVAEVETQRDQLEKRIDGLQRKLKIEARLRQGKTSYVDRGKFDAPGEAKDNENIVTDPTGEDEGNRVLRLVDDEVFSEEAWIPDDIEALRVRFRVLVTAAEVEDEAEDVEFSEAEGDEADGDVEGEERGGDGTGSVKVQILDTRSNSKGKSIDLLPAEDWVQVELVFNDVGDMRRRITVEGDGFAGEVFIDDIEVVSAYPVVLEPSIYKYYETPVEKVYYYFSQQLKAAYNENVELELPRVTRGTVSLRFKLNGKDLNYRFGTLAKEADSAQITVGPLGGSTEVYRIEKQRGPDDVWQIVQIADQG